MPAPTEEQGIISFTTGVVVALKELIDCDHGAAEKLAAAYKDKLGVLAEEGVTIREVAGVISRMSMQK